MPFQDIQWLVFFNISSKNDPANILLLLFFNDRKGSRNFRTSRVWAQLRHSRVNLVPSVFPLPACFCSFCFFLSHVNFHVKFIRNYGTLDPYEGFSLKTTLSISLEARSNHKKPKQFWAGWFKETAASMMLSSGIFARVAFYPSLLWGIVTESSTKRWYDRVDTHLILGALPFKSQTKEVSRSLEKVLQAMWPLVRE